MVITIYIQPLIVDQISGFLEDPKTDEMALVGTPLNICFKRQYLLISVMHDDVIMQMSV